MIRASRKARSRAAGPRKSLQQPANADWKFNWIDALRSAHEAVVLRRVSLDQNAKWKLCFEAVLPKYPPLRSLRRAILQPLGYAKVTQGGILVFGHYTR
jgi:hypothetical protein